MNAVEMLFAEHRLIGRVAHSLEQFAATIREDHQSARCDFLRFVTFFREYADLSHHVKEEEFLLPALVEAGLRWDEGVLAQLQKEHEFERQLLQSLQHLALQFGDWSNDDRRRAIEISNRFVTFMRHHLAIEDAQVFPLVNERLSADARSSLEAKLERFDSKRARDFAASLLVSLGNELVAKYGGSAS